MICEFGDVVVVPFPFVDRPVSKRRPAVVLSSRAFNAENDHTLLAMVTTVARSAWPRDRPIADLGAAGLTHPSVVRWKLFTLPNQLILRTAGALGESDRSFVAAAARKIVAPA